MKNEQLENTVIYMHLQQGNSVRKISEELKIRFIRLLINMKSRQLSVSLKS